MTTKHRTLTRTAPFAFGAVRVALGVLWMLEGVAKYRAGFGAVDILLVVDSAAQNARVPDAYAAFATSVLGNLPTAFGALIPFLEVGLGVALVLGVLTVPAALGSIATLMMYWLADQLIAQYPVMVLVSAIVLVAPAAAGRFSVTSLLRARRGLARRLPARP